MPIIIPVVAALVTGTGAAAVAGKPKKLKNIGEKKKAWLDSFIAAGKPTCKSHNIPYQICIAQAALESGWGCAAPGFNFFGIKGSGSNGSQAFVSTEVLGGKKVKLKMTFAKYKSMEDGIAGYCKAMNGNKLFAPGSKNFSNDPIKYITWLWSSGYATGPNYISCIIGILSLIYRVTGNEDFVIVNSTEMKSLIKKLKAASPGKRRNICAKELNVDLSA